MQFYPLRSPEDSDILPPQCTFPLEDPMRMLMSVKFPIEPFNTAVRQGTVSVTIKRILDESKPESAFFTSHEGHRGGILVVDVSDPADIPRLAEPWFLLFNAEVDFKIAMTPEDLGRANLAGLGKNWS